VAGLEDFGFTVAKKKNDGDEVEGGPDDFDEEDMKDVVDGLSDDEGDEEAVDMARQEMEKKEEKERHKEMLRRMRDGYDGRRGGIAGGGAGARGINRFDELVSADNKEDSKRLGLLNDDELDGDDEEGEKPKAIDEEDDEAALLDTMLKDRFLDRSSTDQDAELFSDEEEDKNKVAEGDGTGKKDDEDRDYNGCNCLF
jgi:hypothetical protein